MERASIWERENSHMNRTVVGTYTIFIRPKPRREEKKTFELTQFKSLLFYSCRAFVVLRKHSSFNLKVSIYTVTQSERSRLNKWHWAFTQQQQQQQCLLFVVWKKYILYTRLPFHIPFSECICFFLLLLLLLLQRTLIPDKHSCVFFLILFSLYVWYLLFYLLCVREYTYFTWHIVQCTK